MRQTKIVCTIGPASSSPEVARHRLALHSGVIPKAIRTAQNTDQVVEDMEDILVSEGAVAPGDTLVFAAGAPLFVRGTTNLLDLGQGKARA